MFSILMSAIGAAFGFVLRSVLVKFVTYFALFFITSGFISYLASLLPDASSINGTLAQLTPSMWYFLDLFQFSVGLPMVVSAWLLRFMIRRIPVIG